MSVNLADQPTTQQKIQPEAGKQVATQQQPSSASSLQAPPALSKPRPTPSQAPADTAELAAEQLPEFFIDLRPRLFKLPEFKDKQLINVRYPLLPPYAFAHIFWDSEDKELLYHVEEQLLDATEKELLKLIQLGLEEMINISFRYATKSNLILKYLEKKCPINYVGTWR